MLNTEQRLEKIRALTKNLTDRFNELLWNNPAKVSKLEHYKPSVIPEFWTRYAELDTRLSDYLEGKIEWEEEAIQMDFTAEGKFPLPVVDVSRDVQNYARELFCWIALQVKDL